jgi:hypothetical protein
LLFAVALCLGYNLDLVEVLLLGHVEDEAQKREKNVEVLQIVEVVDEGVEVVLTVACPAGYE